MSNNLYDFVLGQSPDNKKTCLWKLDLNHPELLVSENATSQIDISSDSHITAVGNYLLEWSAGKKDHEIKYALHAFDPSCGQPLGKKPVQSGVWDGSRKFFHGHLDFGHFNNRHKGTGRDKGMQFVSMNNFVLAWTAEPGRGNYHLWNFDPGSKDPLQYGYNPDGAWVDIEHGHQLVALGNYILDWVPEERTYRLWSFDPQERNPISLPVVHEGKWRDIDADHRLVAIGEWILDWVPTTLEYRLWKFDPKSKNPLGKKPVRSGKLSKAVTKHTNLIGVQPNHHINEEKAAIPGSIDYMRTKIKHVVYYMVENRSFDHVCGWLYDKQNKPAQTIGRKGPFKGTSESDFNLDANGKKIPVSVYKNGKLSKDFNLELLEYDPHHDHSDVMRQLFHPDGQGYYKRSKPNMGGFVINNANPTVMQTYTPEQLPVLNGLAKGYAISDEWFSSMPGGTDVNRAFSLSGSSYKTLDNFQNGAEYAIWPDMPHRPSIWKTLWSNGVSDWKIYNSIEWIGFVFSYHLFLQGQIPSVDDNVEKTKKANKANKTEKPSKFIAGIDQFYEDARTGKLPAFSYVEPIWIAKTGTTSYHPGADLVPGEVELNKIYEALKAGPNWDETLLVITFDEHGGIHDHVPPPYAENPWPNDENNGFKFDIMGVRIPTILVSPMIGEKTVFRSSEDTAYDATSFMATLLNWFGVPKSKWGLGERTNHAPTFEAVINNLEARKDLPSFTPPYDKTHPVPPEKIEPHDLHRTIAHKLVMTLGKDKVSSQALQKAADDISGGTKTMKEMHRKITAFQKKVLAD